MAVNDLKVVDVLPLPLEDLVKDANADEDTLKMIVKTLIHAGLGITNFTSEYVKDMLLHKVDEMLIPTTFVLKRVSDTGVDWFVTDKPLSYAPNKAEEGK